MQDILDFIVNEALVMLPALWVLGAIIKHTELISDKWIPLILLGVSMILSPLVIGGYSAASIVQAILVAGGSVLGHQIVKQAKKEE